MYSWHAAWVTEGPGWRPFFIQYAAPRAERLAEAHRTGTPLLDWSFDRVDLETPDPASAGQWLARVLGVECLWSDGMTEVPATWLSSAIRARHCRPGDADRAGRH